ncbi:SIR2 family protein [Vibrio parahaemolyticus]|uniref:SIR2 family protein n=1 Tax=Vibrio parahaemolyticus TaxID=670 RepID=UPI000427B0AA|nr:SIR2 family protein [Vibrio parahaemolyticus]
MKPTTDQQRQRFVKELLKDLTEENLAIFAGAGLSAPAGFVSWSELLRPVAEELELEIEKETDLVALAQYHCNSNLANRGKLNQLLINELSDNANVTENHQILARLPISTYWTTNYDKLIENSLTEAGKIPDTKYRIKQLSFTKRGRDAVVYKMHGDIEHPDEAVLTKDDYESYHVKMQPFINALSGDLVSKTFLFLGFSFTDPNLDYILSRVRVSYSTDQRQHYCIQKLVEPNDGESEADTEYRKRKQELFIQDLLRFGIKTILVTSYAEITDILRQLEWAFRRKTIFISGSAHEYGRWDSSAAENFIYSLAKEISSLGFRIVSGFGLGVGSSVITGALEHVYMSGRRLDSDQLILRPFPQTEVGTRPIAQVWHDYRTDMISYSGIAIFLFGNKLKDGKVVIADGLIKEFEIAKSNGLILIPVGATEYASREIYCQLLKEGYFDSDAFHENERKFINQICDKKSDLTAIQSGIIDLLKSLK